MPRKGKIWLAQGKANRSKGFGVALGCDVFPHWGCFAPLGQKQFCCFDAMFSY